MLASAVSRATYRVARSVLFRVDPERIHGQALRGLARAGDLRTGRALLRLAGAAPAARGTLTVAGITFRNRVGIGAGFDKDGVALAGWAALGLGFAEVGTVTPVAQPGSARPRLFRLSTDEALINRMGFNNEGADGLAERIARAEPALPAGFVVGINIGRGRETPEELASDDYATAFRAVAPVADYVAVNISSPNTPGLRAMQSVATLSALLATLTGVRGEMGMTVPILVKLAPDLDDGTVAELADAAMSSGAVGLILGNTSTARRGLRASPQLRQQAGGLSGRPLLARMLELIDAVRGRMGGDAVLVASGGIGSGGDAAAAVEAGADLVQLWTGLVYRGPALIGEAIRATS
jgi:dihydroorotate dehydrogenase